MDRLNFRTGSLPIDIHVLPRRQAANTEPKTKSSIRTVILPPALLEVLKAYQQTVTSRWIFPSPAKEDSPLTQNYVRRRMHQTLERAGCKVVRFHDLRHTAASMMIANGVDLVNAAAELGHATASTTLNIYAHQVARARAEASGVRAGAFTVLRQS